ncbi:alanine racemase [Amaricoccus sp.]|uniref:alanine racemase n=1 Tax=Amaricoccus sp. TaxID=1872485 RepID=UPI001D8A7AFA|nr:alanine racemase [Amaricoccus sp.]MCC0067770.1 alanine racemase [Rhodovulum sp.]HRW15061.1 alanine racemase [Amaricoccus sp.]
MPAPTIAIDLEAIAENTRAIVGRCAAQGVAVYGVTKATGGLPMVGRAMLRGGATGLGESRIDNVRRLRRGGLTCPIMMLRIPSITEAPDVVRLCDASLNSERAVLEALDTAAVQQARVHDVIVMLEMGDRREGVSAEELMPLCELVLESPGLRLAGLGANFMCASGVLPTMQKLEALAAHVEAVEARFGVRLDTVSGGNSANLPLMEQAAMPARINQLRIGAAILRGENSITGDTLPWLRGDAFSLEAELVEIKTKHSLPEGETGRDAFGMVKTFVDRGERVRGIVNLGRVDMRPEGLTARDPDVEITTASSDHLIVDLTGSKRFAVGDPIRFDMDYGALVQAFLSPYVEKHLVGREKIAPRPTRLRLFAPGALAARPETAAFLAEVREVGLATATDGATDPGDLPLWICARRAETWESITTGISDRAELGLLWCDSELGPAAAAEPESLALVGLRTATREESDLIRRRDVLALTMEDIDLVGIREAMRRALQRVTVLSDGFALVLDASVGRGMEPDELEAGLSYRECSTAMELVAASGGLKALALTGFDADASPSALKAAYGYLLSALGKRILRGETR